jgi:hypothetical protein
MYQHLPSKPFLFSALFHRGPVYLIINTWDHNVDVPVQLQGSEMAVLRLFPNDPTKSTGIHVDAEFLRASVWVDDAMHACAVPWRAVGSMFAPRDGCTMEWPAMIEEGVEDDELSEFVDDEFATLPVIQLGVIDGGRQSATEVPVQQETAPALQLVTVD